VSLLLALTVSPTLVYLVSYILSGVISRRGLFTFFDLVVAGLAVAVASYSSPSDSEDSCFFSSLSISRAELGCFLVTTDFLWLLVGLPMAYMFRSSTFKDSLWTSLMASYLVSSSCKVVCLFYFSIFFLAKFSSPISI